VSPSHLPLRAGEGPPRIDQPRETNEGDLKAYLPSSGFGHAGAARPALSLGRSPITAWPVDKAGYYYRR